MQAFLRHEFAMRSRFGSYTSHSGYGTEHSMITASVVAYKVSLKHHYHPFYRLPPKNQFVQKDPHENKPGPPGRDNVRYNIKSPAVHPPIMAVSVTYILNRAAAVIARSAPPGIDLCLAKAG